METYISFKEKDGSRMTAFVTSDIGVTGTTKCWVIKQPDGRFEARMGIAIMGSPNMSAQGFKDCGFNPYHSKFNDNYAQGFGQTEAEAIEEMKKECGEIADSLWYV